MNKIFLWILVVVIAVIILIMLLQIMGILPKRCDDLGPGYHENSDGTFSMISISGKYCYGIWQSGFWIKPNYL